MSLLHPWMLLALPLMALPVVIHLLNQRRYQTKSWAAMLFLMQAHQAQRGHAKIRQWAILAIRTMAIGALILAASRPLMDGLAGWSFGNGADSTIFVLDRSPSMQQTGLSGESKLQSSVQRIANVFSKWGRSDFAVIDSVYEEPSTLLSVQSLIDSRHGRSASNTADIPAMLNKAVEYSRRNQSGSTDVWICSDLRLADWKPDSSDWLTLRESVRDHPGSMRFHLLAYPEQPPSINRSIRVKEIWRVRGSEASEVVLSIEVACDVTAHPPSEVPVMVEINGVSTRFIVKFDGNAVAQHEFRIPIAPHNENGWGHLSIPADANLADNDAYFVIDEVTIRRVILVSESADVSRVLKLAASVSPDTGTETGAEVEWVEPSQFDALSLDEVALVVWQASLPDDSTSLRIESFVNRGGQVVFFPPSQLESGLELVGNNAFNGVRWSRWVHDQGRAMVESWRRDQDLLVVTSNGEELPVDELQIDAYGKLEGDITVLATLSGGDPLLARVPTAKGGVFFCTTLPSEKFSSLAENGVVLYAMIQRAIDQGLISLVSSSQCIAGQVPRSMTQSLASWHRVAGDQSTSSSEYAFQCGVYEIDSEQVRSGQGVAGGGNSVAVNRSEAEDQPGLATVALLQGLFDELDFTRVDGALDQESTGASEVWRFFLLAMLGALLFEAILCLPRSLKKEIVPKSSSQTSSWASLRIAKAENETA
ncbi:hypothetical protein CA13_44100 [Planctomycetes bacterium CA13]|uniref:Aerotolerance regulator N-terminal domain-containing protein n=1 Tax=Novipirellula herctigrandis TaxID=2527986 RepID=A0A5C5Z7A4_9BACT|nr:hypothetical protein CA13_44100 [Planctomycetes bacterium CA13]